MANTNGFSTVLIAGATGFVGEPIANAFLKSQPKWSVSILVSAAALNDPKKKATTDNYIALGATLVVGDINHPETYKDKLKGIDVIVSALGMPAAISSQTVLAHAAKEAGVKLFVPSEYGWNYDKVDVRSLVVKVQARREIEKIGLNHIYISTGAFYESLFGYPLWGNDLANKKVALWGDRSTKISTSPFWEVAEILPLVVNDPTVVNTDLAFGLTVTSGEIFDLALEAVGGKDHATISHYTPQLIEERIREHPDTSLPDELLLLLVNGSAYDSSSVDGSKYRNGKKFTTVQEFLPGFLAKLGLGGK